MTMPADVAWLGVAAEAAGTALIFCIGFILGQWTARRKARKQAEAAAAAAKAAAPAAKATDESPATTTG